MSRTGFKIACALVCMMFSSPVIAQRIFLDHVEINENKIIVQYDLYDPDPAKEFIVSLYTSHDNYSLPLAEVTGDVGKEVKAGVGKKITWEVTKELGPFKGNLTFEIRAGLYLPFIKSISIDEGQVYKRGKTYSIKWVPGNVNTSLNMELYDGFRRIMTATNVPNDGTHMWAIPVSYKPGAQYKWKFINATNENEAAYSHQFTIRRKVPLGVKALAVAVVGGAAVLSGGSSATPSPGPPVGKTLPGPPDPP